MQTLISNLNGNTTLSQAILIKYFVHPETNRVTDSDEQTCAMHFMLIGRWFRKTVRVVGLLVWFLDALVVFW